MPSSPVTTATPAPVEFLHAIQAGRYDGNDDWHAAHVVAFPIIRKTPRRIYYDARESWEGRPRARFVDRQQIEADGEVYRRSASWWETDCHLYLNPPPAPETSGSRPDLATLKAAMAAAHPDRGGSHEAFINARQQYETARNREAS